MIKLGSREAFAFVVVLKFILAFSTCVTNEFFDSITDSLTHVYISISMGIYGLTNPCYLVAKYSP